MVCLHHFNANKKRKKYRAERKKRYLQVTVLNYTLPQKSFNVYSPLYFQLRLLYGEMDACESAEYAMRARISQRDDARGNL